MAMAAIVEIQAELSSVNRQLKGSQHRRWMPDGGTGPMVARMEGPAAGDRTDRQRGDGRDRRGAADMVSLEIHKRRVVYDRWWPHRLGKIVKRTKTTAHVRWSDGEVWPRDLRSACVSSRSASGGRHPRHAAMPRGRLMKAGP
jgi:hypothetical protein